jgi:hypothetical protein
VLSSKGKVLIFLKTTHAEKKADHWPQLPVFPSPTYSTVLGNVPGSIKHPHSQFFYNSVLQLLAFWGLYSAHKAY